MRKSKNISFLEQDDIFQTMSANRKIEVGSILWKMAKTIVGEKINYAHRRPTSSSRTHCKNPR